MRIARGLLWCRLMTTRLTLYRPYLLSAALGRRRWSDLNEPELNLMLKCMEVARDGVDIITLDWFPNQILSWNSTWHLFQIALVMVLAVVSDREYAKRQRCGDYIAKALDLFVKMEPLSAGAARSREVIQVLFSAIEGQERLEGGEGFDVAGASDFDFQNMELVWGDENWFGLFNESP